MENKRIIIATVICFVILVGWQYIAEHMGWVPKQAEQTEQIETQAEQTANLTDPAFSDLKETVPFFAPGEGKNIVVRTPLYTAVFHSAGGVLESFVLNNISETSSPHSPFLDMIGKTAKSASPMGLLINGQPSWNIGSWTISAENLILEDGDTKTLVFEGNLNGLIIRRELTFDAATYLISEKITYGAEEGKAFIVRVGYTLAGSEYSSSSTYNPMQVVWDSEGSYETESDVSKLTEEGMVEDGALFFAGLSNNYFLSAVVPQSKNGLVKARIQNDVWRVAYEEQPLTVNAGLPVSSELSWWIGPKDAKLLDNAPNELKKTIHYGIFGILATPLLWLLNFFQSFVGNWGIAIILLTIFIKLLFWPLTKKSYKSMEQMKKIAPLMEDLKKKYGSDREALSREMMQLYRTYNINPMSGCLPILVQLPVFIALYNALLNSENLRHAEFITYLPFTDIIWLADLSVKDPLYITPLVMGATMFLQQWLSPAVGDPTQRKVMMLMPVIFTFMFLNFPAGLVVYWLANNVLSIGQQWWTLRKVR